MEADPTRLSLASVALVAALWVCSSSLAGAALISHWQFDGNANATVGTNGTEVGGAGYGPDRFGTPNRALSVSGASQQYVEVAGGGGLDNLQSGTIAFFVSWSGTQDSACCASSGDVAARQSNGVFSNQVIGLNGTDPGSAMVTWQAYNAGAPALVGGTAVGDGIWHHIAVTYTSGSHTLYLDGNIDGTSVAAGTINTNPAIPLTIGAWFGDGSGYSTSLIDDFKVFDTVLSQSEVQALIPEPSVGALAFLGALGFLIRRRR